MVRHKSYAWPFWDVILLKGHTSLYKNILRLRISRRGQAGSRVRSLKKGGWYPLSKYGPHFTDMWTTSQSLWHHGDILCILTWIRTRLIGTHIHTSTLTFGIERCFGVFTRYSEQRQLTFGLNQVFYHKLWTCICLLEYLLGSSTN